MFSLVKGYLPHLLAGVSISLVMVSAYAAVGFSSSSVPKATWATSPLTMTFAATAGEGSATDSLTCTPSAPGIAFTFKISTGRVAGSVSPPGLSCSSSPSTVTLRVACLVSAALCKGSYSGLVQIRQPSNYRDVPANLVVKVTVT